MNYTINWIGEPSMVDADNDNVDVSVRFENGELYVATFFTLSNIESLMLRYESTGECYSGLYFWATEPIVVRRLTPEVISSVIADLIDRGDFTSAFRAFPVPDDS